jgi:signal peptidase II
MITIGIISIIILIVDFIFKYLVSNNMIINVRNCIIPNFFYLTYTKNDGAAWSSFSGQRYLLIAISIVIIIFVFGYLRKKKKISKLEILGFSLLLGGALGNLLDRIIYGYVIDYLDFNLFNYNYPIFNLADSCVVLGVVVILIETIIQDQKNKKQ